MQKGSKHSEEAKKKISEAKKGIKLSDETRRKMSAAKLGVKRGPYKKKEKKNELGSTQERNNG